MTARGRRLTRAQFIQQYCRDSNVTWLWLKKRCTVLPCMCKDELCRGWQMVPKELVEWERSRLARRVR